MYDNLNIKNSIIITGGNKGIGLEITKSFLNQTNSNCEAEAK